MAYFSNMTVICFEIILAENFPIQNTMLEKSTIYSFNQNGRVSTSSGLNIENLKLKSKQYVFF